MRASARLSSNDARMSSASSARYPSVTRSRSATRAVDGSRDVLAGVEARDVGADRLEREASCRRSTSGGGGGRRPFRRRSRTRGPSSARSRRATVHPPRSPTRARHELFLVARALDCLGHAQLECEPREAPELVVRAQDEHVDARQHLRDRLVRDVGEGLATALVEDEVGAVAEVQELEVVLEDAIDALEQAVVRLKQRVARSEAARLEHDRLILELQQIGHDEPLELARSGLDLLDPALVQLVPVAVVVAAASREQLRPPGERRFVGHRVRGDVDVAVEDTGLDAERGRHHEQARAGLVEGENGVTPRQRVEREEGLGGVHPFLEPEAALLEVAPTPRRRGGGRRTSPPSPRSPRGSSPRTGSGSPRAPLPIWPTIAHGARFLRVGPPLWDSSRLDANRCAVCVSRRGEGILSPPSPSATGGRRRRPRAART